MINTPQGLRFHIVFMGKTNSGKSSVINALTNQEISIVSDFKGTTTDPVYKSMEILPIGPCMLIDTGGLDDKTELGKLRIKKSFEALRKADAVIYVIDGDIGPTNEDKVYMAKISEYNVPIVGVRNKSDLLINKNELFFENIKFVDVSSKFKIGIEDLKDELIKIYEDKKEDKNLLDGIVNDGDFVILVTPIDSSAPKGRMILPQQQIIRAILDKNAMAIVLKPNELKNALSSFSKVDLVITDSQAFEEVDNILPKEIPLTSFSIIFSFNKGEINNFYNNVSSIEELQDGDKILIAEACTHHKQSDDIGTVKIPNMLREYTGKKIFFSHSNGMEFPEDLEDYKLIIHCGGCMINKKEMEYRIKSSKNIPIINYGMAIAYMKGILERAVKVFEKEEI